MATLKAKNAVEEVLAEKIAMGYWRLLIAYRLRSGLHAHAGSLSCLG